MDSPDRVFVWALVLAYFSGSIFVDGQVTLSTAGLFGIGRVGWQQGAYAAGVGYLSRPGTSPIVGPVVFLGAGF